MKIQINTDTPNELLRETIIHEMIHYILDINNVGMNTNQEIVATLISRNYDYIGEVAKEYERKYSK